MVDELGERLRRAAATAMAGVTLDDPSEGVTAAVRLEPPGRRAAPRRARTVALAVAAALVVAGVAAAVTVRRSSPEPSELTVAYPFPPPTVPPERPTPGQRRVAEAVAATEAEGGFVIEERNPSGQLTQRIVSDGTGLLIERFEEPATTWVERGGRFWIHHPDAGWTSGRIDEDDRLADRFVARAFGQLPCPFAVDERRVVSPARLGPGERCPAGPPAVGDGRAEPPVVVLDTDAAGRLSTATMVNPQPEDRRILTFRYDEIPPVTVPG